MMADGAFNAVPNLAGPNRWRIVAIPNDCGGKNVYRVSSALFTSGRSKVEASSPSAAASNLGRVIPNRQANPDQQ